MGESGRRGSPTGLLAGLTPNGVSIVEDAKNTYFLVSVDVSLKERELYELLVGKLASTCDDFVGEVRARFERLLLFLVRFVSSRAGVPNSIKPYLGPIDANNNPVEADLQNDLFSHLGSASFTDVEKVGMAAGRSDLLIPGNGFNFVIENKRTKDPWEAAVNGFLGQAVAYQQADVKLGVLAILDLTDRDAGYPSLERCFEVRGRAVGGEVLRSIVVMRVPGNRKSPSAMSK